MARKPTSPRLSLQTQRRYAGLAMMMVLACCFYYWFFSAGIPVWFAPTASAAEIASGQELFEHEWTPNDPLASGDGLGPVFNAKSCVFCHFQGGVGGGGEIGHNATHFEVLPQPGKNEYLTGVVHDFSVSFSDKESVKKLNSMYPIVKFPPPPPSPSGCSVLSPARQPFDPVRTTSVQSTALFGAGWIDRISTKAITLNHRNRAASNTFAELKLDFHRVTTGKLRVLPDGRIGKFGWKAQFATLEEFVATACANELGLGNPMCAQAKPIGQAESVDAKTDLTKRQFRDLCAFVDTLPRPVEVLDSVGERGKELFKSVGCAQCHVPDMGGVKGVYSDFLLYRVVDPSPSGGSSYGPEPPEENSRPSHVPHPSEWRTPPLWGVADSAPYLHDGSAMTLAAAIQAHGGDAKVVTKAFQSLNAADQMAVIKFLESLKAPPDAVPVKTKSNMNRVAKK